MTGDESLKSRSMSKLIGLMSKFGAIFEGPALESLKKVVKNGWKGALFLGSVKADKNLWRIGNWCDVLPWKPIPDSG